MGKFKIWEILLFVAVVLLGAIAYEAHKTNSQGRYVMVGTPWELFDSKTGDFWTRRYPVDTIIIGDDTSDVYQWVNQVYGVDNSEVVQKLYPSADQANPGFKNPFSLL